MVQLKVSLSLSPLLPLRLDPPSHCGWIQLSVNFFTPDLDCSCYQRFSFGLIWFWLSGWIHPVIVDGYKNVILTFILRIWIAACSYYQQFSFGFGCLIPDQYCHSTKIACLSQSIVSDYSRSTFKWSPIHLVQEFQENQIIPLERTTTQCLLITRSN